MVSSFFAVFSAPIMKGVDTMIFGKRKYKPVEFSRTMEIQRDEVLEMIENNKKVIAELERLNKILHFLAEKEP